MSVRPFGHAICPPRGNKEPWLTTWTEKQKTMADPVGRHQRCRLYSHRDEELRKDLEDHLALLKRQGCIAGWNDRMIGAGDEWKGQIDIKLMKAQIILLLISPSFLADYCYDIEFEWAAEKHDRGEAKVIPVLLGRWTGRGNRLPVSRGSPSTCGP